MIGESIRKTYQHSSSNFSITLGQRERQVNEWEEPSSWVSSKVLYATFLRKTLKVIKKWQQPTSSKGYNLKFWKKSLAVSWELEWEHILVHQQIKCSVSN